MFVTLLVWHFCLSFEFVAHVYSGFSLKSSNSHTQVRVCQKRVSVGRWRPPPSAKPSYRPDLQPSSHCHSEKHVSLKGDINCLCAVALSSWAQVHLCCCSANNMQSAGCGSSFLEIIDPGDPTCSPPTLPLSLAFILLCASSPSLPPPLCPRQDRMLCDWLVVSKSWLVDPQFPVSSLATLSFSPVWSPSGRALTSSAEARGDMATVISVQGSWGLFFPFSFLFFSLLLLSAPSHMPAA